MKSESETTSRVSERMSWLRGRRVEVRLVHADTGQITGEQFEAVYQDVVPLGREYFFVFSVDGVNRLVRTPSVVSLTEIAVAGVVR